MKKIRIYYERLPDDYYQFMGPSCANDVHGVAVDEEDNIINEHTSSSVTWHLQDMGVDGEMMPKEYAKRYPDGFELVWEGNREHSI